MSLSASKYALAFDMYTSSRNIYTRMKSTRGNNLGCFSVYPGNERDAANLQRLQDLNITYVLNTTSHIPKYFENQGIHYKRIPASDSGCQNLKQYFEEAAAFIGM